MIWQLKWKRGQPFTSLFKYRKNRSNRWRTMALDVMEFLRRFLQHVLPTGFMKVRYYGFMNPSCSVSLDKIVALIELAFGFTIVLAKSNIEVWRTGGRT